VKTEDRVKKLSVENQQLVDRWLKKVNEEAEKMNEVNVLYEKLMEANRLLELHKRSEEELRQQQAIAMSMNDDILSRMESYL
jgi:hypothetical protein